MNPTGAGATCTGGRSRPFLRPALTALRVIAAVLGFTAGAVFITPAGQAVEAAGVASLKQAYQQRFVGRPAPQFALRDTQGRGVRLTDHRGNVVLLNFWYSTCPPCRGETPALISLYNYYKDNGLMVLGVNMDDIVIPRYKGARREEFLNEFKITYPVLIGDLKIFHAYGEVPVQPMSFLIDRDGIVVQIFWGARPGSSLDQAVRPYLMKPASSNKAASTRPGS